MTKPRTQILSAEKIGNILNRIAIQILESNFYEPELVLVGIQGQGYKMAAQLKSILENEAISFQVNLVELMVDKLNPVAADIRLSADLSLLDGKSIVIVDDVMNTGRTQAYGLAYILQTKVKKVETAVLVNRSHTAFPISATYSGISLSTTIDEHIEVRIEGEQGVFLF